MYKLLKGRAREEKRRMGEQSVFVRRKNPSFSFPAGKKRAFSEIEKTIFGRERKSGAGALEGERKSGAARGLWKGKERVARFWAGVILGWPPPMFLRGAVKPILLKKTAFSCRGAPPGWAQAFSASGQKPGKSLRGSGFPCLQGSFGSFSERRLLSGRIPPRKSDFCDRLSPQREDGLISL